MPATSLPTNNPLMYEKPRCLTPDELTAVYFNGNGLPDNFVRRHSVRLVQWNRATISYNNTLTALISYLGNTASDPDPQYQFNINQFNMPTAASASVSNQYRNHVD